MTLGNLASNTQHKENSDYNLKLFTYFTVTDTRASLGNCVNRYILKYIQIYGYMYIDIFVCGSD